MRSLEWSAFLSNIKTTGTRARLAISIRMPLKPNASNRWEYFDAISCIGNAVPQTMAEIRHRGEDEIFFFFILF
jgi:hypothetical protein